MKLSDDEVLAVRSRFKKLVNSTTKRTAEGITLSNSPLHLKAFVDCTRAQELARGWDGPREELDLKLKEMEDSIVSDLKAADALVADFPPGTGNAFGHTGGTPVVEDDDCVCHRCGQPVRLDPVSGALLPFQRPGPVFLKLETGSDVLLFVMHPACFGKKVSSNRTRNDGLDAGLDFVQVPVEEWMLLLIAKTVLSS